MDATGRILGGLMLLAIVYVAMRGTLPAYLSQLGI